MTSYQSILVLAALVSLSACSSTANFSCNATAGDTCLSLDEVNAMTESHVVHYPNQAPQSPKPLIKAHMKRIWVAPSAQHKGQGQLVYVPERLDVIA